jgi:hypothetical protein
MTTVDITGQLARCMAQARELPEDGARIVNARRRVNALEKVNEARELRPFLAG